LFLFYSFSTNEDSSNSKKIGVNITFAQILLQVAGISNRDIFDKLCWRLYY
jgi:hypothetical protein